MSFVKISNEQHVAFVSSLKAGQYNLLLGAGVSLDSENSVGKLPSGGVLRDDLCDLKGVSKNKSLQKVFALLSDAEIAQHITKRFSSCTAGPTLTALSTFVWRRAFTWNIDDALEAAYRLKGAKQKLVTAHFRDDYNDERVLSDLLLVKLHGSVTHPAKGYVFARDEYIQVMKENSPWMTVLSQFLTREPFVIAGASMDEVDLDFYLSYRTANSGRDDQGPSVLVEPFPDAVTINECETHNLLLFKGTALEFFDYCQQVAPNRPTPYELIPTESRNILPEKVSSAEALAFYSDFELVPSSERLQDSASRFFYGHAPEWSDLASGFDVSRSITSSVVNDVENLLNNTAEDNRIILLTDDPGTGKTTVVRRVAFEISRRGTHTLVCSALSRLEYDKTLSIVDDIDGPLLIVVDNFADQVSPFADIISKTRKKDLVVLASERSYRNRYLFQSLSGVPYHRAASLKLRAVDVEAVIERYTSLGIVGSSRAIKDLSGFIRSTSDDPIAVVCCRVLNDYRPLDRIAYDLMEECNEVDQDRYLTAALSQHCFGGGVRHEILSSIFGAQGYREQLGKVHPLPLSYYDRRTNTHVVPQNSTIAMRILDNMSKRDPLRLLKIFTNLAITLAPRVNRKAIKQRSSEARLASRLFDFDSVVDGMLGNLAPAFYEATQKAWQWNSRYWEQVALMNVARHNSSGIRGMTEYLDLAVQNARHAASIENHPLPLTTLSKILFIQMVVPGYSRVSAFNEAFDCSDRAIKIEKSWARKSVHPYVTMFRGAREYLERGGMMSSTQIQRVRDLVREAQKLFPKDQEIGDNLHNLKALM